MDSLAVSVALICMLAVVMSQPHEIRRCHTAANCDPDECCLAYARLRGKREVPLGTCVKRGMESGKCLYKEHATPPKGQRYVCPCAEKFKCHPTGLTEIPIGEIGICKKEIDDGCNTDKDCAFNQCCLLKNRPIGRRKRSSWFKGTCQPVGFFGDKCFVDHPNMCPRCYSHPFIRCVPTSVIDIPLGRIGKCLFRPPPWWTFY